MIVGLLFVLLGIYLLLKIFVPGFDFDLTWDIFLPAVFIAIGSNNLIKLKKFDLFNIVMVLLGLLYLLVGLNLIPSIDYKIIGPILLITLGIVIISGAFRTKKVKKIRVANKTKTDDIVTYNGIFSGIEEKIVEDDFKGTNAYAIFGGVDLDLSEIKIKEDILINVYGIFGGVGLILPKNVNIVVKSSCAFGGVDNKANNKKDDKQKTITVNATAVFGGVELK